MKNNQNLFFSPEEKGRAFSDVLKEVQEYISSKYSTLMVEGGSEEVKQQVKRYITKYICDYRITVKGKTQEQLIDDLYTEMAEFSFLTKYIFGTGIEEIDINSWRDIEIQYNDGRCEKLEEHFESPEHAVNVIRRMLHVSGMVLDNASPAVLGHLSKNIRIAVLKTPLVDEDVGIAASIRIVNPQSLKKENFVDGGTATGEMLDFLAECLRYGISICVAGATSSGKTTLAGWLLTTIPDGKRIFTIENGSRELALVREKDGKVTNSVIHTLTRYSENEKQNIDQDMLLDMALRFNPEIICVGEMRSSEAYTAQESARTGHTVLTTIHSNSCESTYSRMRTLCKRKYDMDDEVLMDLVSKYDEYKEKVKELEKELQTRKDTFEKMTEPLVYVCDCYQKFNVVTGMPKSTFGDSFGYAMQKEISDYMQDFYAGKVSREDLDSYFEKCCTSMRTYRTGQHQTSGTNEADNTQIVSEMYEVFAKENARAAGQANYQEGKALNEKYYSDGHSDWTYYNSDYYYQCNDTNAALRESVRKMTEKWELDGIDCDEIEANSSLTLDGGFDFNSIWNSDFRNQVGRSSLAKESTIPPENFKMFFKEQVTSFTEENKFNGNLKITIGKSNFDLDVPFQTLRTGSEGEIRNVWDLMEDYYSDTKDNSKVKNFLRNMSVFTRWYSYETGINNRFGDYEVSRN